MSSLISESVYVLPVEAHFSASVGSLLPCTSDLILQQNAYNCSSLPLMTTQLS